MKRCSISLIITEMQIKTTMRYHVTSARILIIKKSTNNKCWRGCEVKGTLSNCWWEYKLIQPLWKTLWRFLKKLGIKPPFDPAIPLLGIYPEETKIEKDTCMSFFIAALFTIVRPWKHPRCSLTDEWIKKLWYIYTMEYSVQLLSHGWLFAIPWTAAWQASLSLSITNFHSLLKPIRQEWNKVTQRDEELYHFLGVEESILWKCLHYKKQFTDSMQFLSNYQWHFPQN